MIAESARGISTFLSQNTTSTQNNIEAYAPVCLYNAFSRNKVDRSGTGLLAYTLRLHKFWNSNRFTLLYWYADKSEHQIGLDNVVRYLMKSSGFSLTMAAR